MATGTDRIEAFLPARGRTTQCRYLRHRIGRLIGCGNGRREEFNGLRIINTPGLERGGQAVLLPDSVFPIHEPPNGLGLDHTLGLGCDVQHGSRGRWDGVEADGRQR